MKQYEKYENVPKKYKFDLNDLLEGKTIETLINELFNLLENELKTKETKYENHKTYLSYLKSQKKTTVLMNKISNYISNNISINLVSPEFNKLSNDLNYKLFEFQKKMGSETNRIFKNEKKLKEWIKLDEFKFFKKDIEFNLEQKKHKFDDRIEEFIKRISRSYVDTYEIFSVITNSELDYKFATSKNGKKIKITPANRQSLLLNKDEKIRKTTYENWANAYLQHKNSLSMILFQHIKNISIWALERKWNSSIESIISSDKVDLKLLTKLYDSVKKNIYQFKRLRKLQKKYFKIKYKKDMKPWDSYLPLVKFDENYSIEKSQKIVYNALKPMGKEYANKLKEVLNENWIDYCVVKNKRAGAYSIGQSYGLNKKYILMNHDGKFSSVSTLAHEIGHSMHSWYSDTNQPFNLSEYPIFLAEIASIFNELLLNDYLIKNTNDNEIKFHLILESINEFDATVRKQTMWSEYEFNLYNRIDKGESFNNFEAIKKVYEDTIKQYINENKKNYKEIDLYGAIMVPHFYYEFYVYKYAIGYLVANYFFQKYKKFGVNELENYINNFLKKGGSEWPIDLLKEAGVDLYDDNFYNEAFAELKSKIDEYEKLGEKILIDKNL